MKIVEEYNPHREKWCEACLREDWYNCTMPHGDLGLVCEDWFSSGPVYEELLAGPFKDGEV